MTVQELRDLWLGGRGLVLTFAFSLLLSVMAYLVATNTALNVQNNIASPQFGTFYNSADRSVRLKFEFVKY